MMPDNPFQQLMESVGTAIDKTENSLKGVGLKIKQVDLKVKTTVEKYKEPGGGIDFKSIPIIGELQANGSINYKNDNAQTLSLSLVPTPLTRRPHELVDPDLIEGDLFAISEVVDKVKDGKLMHGFHVTEAKVEVDFELATDKKGKVNLVLVSFGAGAKSDTSNTATITIVPMDQA